MTIHDAPSTTQNPTSHSPIGLPTTTPRLLDVPPRRVLMYDGVGSPESPAFRTAVGRLYAAAGGALDAPLEGLWSEGRHDSFDITSDKASWTWTLLLGMSQDVDGSRLPEGVRIETFAEGRAAEVLHIGSYDDEEPTIAALISFITKDCGTGVRGRHHEIYLDDPRTCPPEQLRTILRQPVR